MGSRIYINYQQLAPHWESMRPNLGRIVFTNGCFDILHAGHVQYLEEAGSLGDFLILGLNDDTSVRELKGPNRPINAFTDRAGVLAGLRSVDLVVGFEQDTPYGLIAAIRPDILVKGGDWAVDQIVGSDLVLARGGEVHSLSFHHGHSTTGILERILERYQLSDSK